MNSVAFTPKSWTCESGPQYHKKVIVTLFHWVSLGTLEAAYHEVDVEHVAAIRLYESLGFRQVKGSISYMWQKSDKTFRPKSRA